MEGAKSARPHDPVWSNRKPAVSVREQERFFAQCLAHSLVRRAAPPGRQAPLRM